MSRARRKVRPNPPMGRSRQCFENAATAVLADPTLGYAEGFISGNKGTTFIHHAWVDKKGKRVEVTPGVGPQIFPEVIFVRFTAGDLKEEYGRRQDDVLMAHVRCMVPSFAIQQRALMSAGFDVILTRVNDDDKHTDATDPS